MTTSTEEKEPVWGDPQPPREKWSGKKTAIAGAIALVVVLGGGAVVYAATGSSGGQSGRGPGGRGGGPNMITRGTGLPDGALHGDFVVAQQDGTFATERIQTGVVTAINDTSVTALSKDGYTQTYTIDASTVANPKPQNGQTVTVTAKVNGQAATATAITRDDQNGRSGPNGRGGQQGQFGQPGQQPPQGGQQGQPGQQDQRGPGGQNGFQGQPPNR